VVYSETTATAVLRRSWFSRLSAARLVNCYRTGTPPTDDMAAKSDTEWNVTSLVDKPPWLSCSGLQVNSYPLKSYPYLGHLLPTPTATCTAIDLLVVSVVYMIIYCLYCLTAISSFSKCNFGICCHLLCIPTLVLWYYIIQMDIFMCIQKLMIRPA